MYVNINLQVQVVACDLWTVNVLYMCVYPVNSKIIVEVNSTPSPSELNLHVESSPPNRQYSGQRRSARLLQLSPWCRFQVRYIIQFTFYGILLTLPLSQLAFVVLTLESKVLTSAVRWTNSFFKCTGAFHQDFAIKSMSPKLYSLSWPYRWNNMHHFSKVASLSLGNFSTP